MPMNNFLDNNFFTAHLKNLTEHFNKNGGNGFLDSLPFKAFMNEDMHQAAFRKSVDFEDAEETPRLRRESFSPSSSSMGRVSKFC